MGIHFTRSPKIRRAPTKTVVSALMQQPRREMKHIMVIEDIWELDYGRGLKVPLFWCKWVNMTLDGVTEDPQYGMTTVDLNNLAYADEPFVLANDVAQVFYVKDISTKPRKRKDKEANASHDEPNRHIVLSGKRNIMGVDDKTDMSGDYQKFDEIAPHEYSPEHPVK